jgi:predicted transposase/invertase (TIGR01784 family)
MDKICKGDRLMESINKKVKNLNEDEDVLDVIIENEDEIIANSMYEKGIEKGIQEGINEGKLSQKKEMAKKMIKDGLDIKTISKYSGLSIDEIKKIQ